MNFHDTRAKLIADVRSAFSRAEAEGRSLDATELEQVRKMNADITSLDEQISLRDAANAAEAADAERRARVPETVVGAETRATSDAVAEYRHFLRTGEQRAQLAGNNSLGGYLVQDDYSGFDLMASMVAAGPALNIFRVINTTTGAPLPIPTIDNTSVVASFIGEGVAAANAANMVFSSVSLGSYTAIAGPNPVSIELLQDSAINIDQAVGELFGEQIGRNINQFSLTGNGTSQPTGLFSVASTSNTASNTAITAAELVDFATVQLDPAYAAGAGWLMHPTTLAKIRNLTSNTSNHFVYQASLREGAPDTLLGKPVYLSSYAPSFAAGAKAIAYGDFRRAYALRLVNGVNVTRLNEAYATAGCVGFVARKRWDGNIVDSKAFKILGLRA